MNIYDLPAFNRLQGIESLSQSNSPLSFQYVDELYPQINNEDQEEQEEQYPYLGYNDMGYETPRTIADQNRILGQTFTQQQPNFFRRMFDRASDVYGSSRDLIGTGIGSLISLASGIPGIGLLTGLINPNPPSQIAVNRMIQQGYGPQLNSIYGPGGIMQGYNPVSAFGPSPLESIINRRNKILERKQAGKAYGASNLEKLNQAIASVGGEGGGAGSFDTSSTPRGETMGDFSGSTRSSRGRQDY